MKIPTSAKSFVHPFNVHNIQVTFFLRSNNVLYKLVGLRLQKDNIIPRKLKVVHHSHCIVRLNDFAVNHVLFTLHSKFVNSLLRHVYFYHRIFLIKKSKTSLEVYYLYFKQLLSKEAFYFLI